MTKEFVLRIRIPSREEIEEISARVAKGMADTIAGRMEEVEKWARELPAKITPASLGLPEGTMNIDIVEKPPETPTPPTYKVGSSPTTGGDGQTPAAAPEQPPEPAPEPEEAKPEEKPEERPPEKQEEKPAEEKPPETTST